MNDQAEKTKPIINCHTHIFTGDQVPPYLAKDYVPPPFYLLFPIPFFMSLYKKYNALKNGIRFDMRVVRMRRRYQLMQNSINRNSILKPVFFLVGLLLTINAFFVIFQWIASFSPPTASIATSVEDVRKLLQDWHLYYVPRFWLWQIPD